MRIFFTVVNKNMTYAPITAFLRPVDAAQLAKASAPQQPSTAPQTVNKWEILRELIAGRVTFALGDRDLTVLEALLSFHPGVTLGGNEGAPVVHPSNASICERLKGMACSTMRRHLSRLVETGFIIRRDSPNGKRYARRYDGEKVVFGFELTPLVSRQAEICAAAETARAAAEHLTRLRETVSLMRRDLSGLATYGAALRPGYGPWDQFADLAALTARALRRKLEATDLEALRGSLAKALDRARNVLEPVSETEVSSTNGARNEQHCQNSKTDRHDLEPCLEQAKAAGDSPEDEPADAVPDEALLDRDLPNIPLGLVLTVCAEIQTYTEDRIRHWHQLLRAADLVRPMMGISPSAWDEAKTAMGPEQAAVVLAAMLERFTEIRAPGGYLRSLSAKADAGAFSCGPMIMALMRKAA